MTTIPLSRVSWWPMLNSSKEERGPATQRGPMALQEKNVKVYRACGPAKKQKKSCGGWHNAKAKIGTVEFANTLTYIQSLFQGDHGDQCLNQTKKRGALLPKEGLWPSRKKT
jgi:hypothetical protein